MITHHPKHELLSSFVEGTLPASISAGIAVHAELCAQCAKNIQQLTKESATDIFLNESSMIQHHGSDRVPTNYNDMISMITIDDEIVEVEIKESLEIEIKGFTYKLPNALRSMSMKGWQKMGKLSRARIDLNEGPLHTSLLHIDKDGGVPSHTHKGFELTLLLDGSFEDEMGSYVKGDFIWLDGKHTHNPHTQTGCLCYTVADDALQFKQGLSKLLNPIGAFIY